MSIEALTTEPASLTAGDTINWLIAVPDYPASAGWTLKYNGLCAAGRIALTSTPSGDSHAVAVAKTTTADYVAGVYSFTKYVESTTERVTLDTLTIQVLPDLAAMTTAYDNRSQAQKILDAIDNTINGTATSGMLAMTIDGTRLEKMTPEQLLNLRGVYAGLVWRERNPGKIGPSVKVVFPRDRYKGPWQN